MEESHDIISTDLYNNIIHSLVYLSHPQTTPSHEEEGLVTYEQHIRDMLTQQSCFFFTNQYYSSPSNMPILCVHAVHLCYDTYYIIATSLQFTQMLTQNNQENTQ